MDWFLKVILILGLGYHAHALTCYECSDSDFDGESTAAETCFMAASSTRNCSSSSDYCRTQLTITDGVVNAVARSCQSNASDHDIHSNVVPSVTKCTTVLDFKGNPTAKTECYFPCKGDKCNNVASDSLKKCNSSCNSGGSCDYISGKCVCDSKHYGEYCNQTKLAGAKRKCVQCTSASGMNCKDFTEANDCPDFKAFCSTTQTSLINSSNEVVRDSIIVTKGCTERTGVTDECFFTDTFTDTPINSGGLYKEFTCVSTCDTDGCNKVVADGQKYTRKTAPKQCVVCNDLTGSTQCNPGKPNVQTRSACPGSDLCIMSVTYLVSERTDLPYTSEPSYTLRSVTRGCASAPAKNSENTRKIEFLNLDAVTITETCDVDGCNDKWPERPRCIQCESNVDTNGFDSCLLNPPPPTVCTYPYHKYCYIQDSGMTHNNITSIHGYRRSIKRGCSATKIPNNCSHTNFRGVKVDSCNMTCEEDGCNAGFGRDMNNAGVIATHYTSAVVLFAMIGSLGNV